MADLGDVPWPPEPIATERLLLRHSEARDREGYVELASSDEVYRYLGGPRPRAEVERGTPEAALDWVGQVLPGEPVVLCTQAANVASVRLATRLGFVEQEGFVEFDAEQWFGARVAGD